MTVLACGTRTVIDAVFGPASSGETSYARALLPTFGSGMLVLADRNFAAGTLFTAIAQTGAELIVRAKTSSSGPKLPILHRLTDGSYRSAFAGTPVRIIDAEIAVTTSAGTHTSVYRLITTLLDEHHHPAHALIRLYHERWEIETAYLELKSSILGGRVLRARTPTGIEQEIYALLVTYQILRTAMTDATNSDPTLDPDRASFSTALNAARDQVIHAAGIITDTTIDLVGTIGQRVLANLMPARRLRINARTVKRAISKYNARGPNIDRRTYQTTLAINILTRPTLTTAAEP